MELLGEFPAIVAIAASASGVRQVTLTHPETGSHPGDVMILRIQKGIYRIIFTCRWSETEIATSYQYRFIVEDGISNAIRGIA